MTKGWKDMKTYTILNSSYFAHVIEQEHHGSVTFKHITISSKKIGPCWQNVSSESRYN